MSLAGFGPFTAAGLRFAMASAAISLWAMATGRPFAIKKGQGIHLLVLSIIFTVQLSLFYFGLSMTNASRGTLIVNFQPFVVLILAHFFIPDDRISKKKTAGLVLGFAGVSFVFLDHGVASAGIRTGDLYILGTTILWGINAVYVKRIIDGFRVFHIVLYPMLFSVPLFLLEGFVWDPVMVGQIDSMRTGRPIVPGARNRRIRVCGLEFFSQDLRRGYGPFIYLYHSHVRRASGRAYPGRTDHKEHPCRFGPDRIRDFRRQLQAKRSHPIRTDKPECLE